MTTIKETSPAGKYRWAVLCAIPAAAVLFQVYVPRFFEYLSFLEVPVMVTIYFSLLWRSEIAAIGYGAAVGLLQDSLSHHPLGMFGIVKTLVGYMTAFLSLRFDIDNTAVRFGLTLLLYFFHQTLYWILTRALLGENTDFAFGRVLLTGLLNALVAVPFFGLLDRLKLDAE